MKLSEEFPLDVVVSMSPASLTLPLLARLARLEKVGAPLHRANFAEECAREYTGDDPAERLLLHAWAMLEQQGLIVNRGDGFCFVSEEGHQIANGQSDPPLAFALVLPRAFLHPELRDGSTWQAFARGDYEEAVSAAFKMLEVTVRARAALGDEHFGVNLMRTAFGGECGPLADREAESGERKACADLFAGAIGMFKSPSSHRYVPHNRADAFHLILFANHLLRIVEERYGKTHDAGRHLDNRP